MQIKHGYSFQSDTDTEVIAVFLKYVYDQNPQLSFKQIVTEVMSRLVSCTNWVSVRLNVADDGLLLFQDGAYAVIIKSRHFPGEVVATKRGG